MVKNIKIKGFRGTYYSVGTETITDKEGVTLKINILESEIYGENIPHIYVDDNMEQIESLKDFTSLIEIIDYYKEHYFDESKNVYRQPITLELFLNSDNKIHSYKLPQLIYEYQTLQGLRTESKRYKEKGNEYQSTLLLNTVKALKDSDIEFLEANWTVTIYPKGTYNEQ